MFYDDCMVSVYRSPHSRKDILHSLGAPHEGDEEIVFPSNLIPSYIKQKNGKNNVNYLFLVKKYMNEESVKRLMNARKFGIFNIIKFGCICADVLNAWDVMLLYNVTTK